MSDAKIISGQLASDCYPATPQQMFNEWASKSSAQWPNITGFIASVAAPSVTDRDKLWIKVDGSGNVQGKFKYGNGRWHWPHPLIPGFTTIAPASITSAADLDTYDGGNAGPVTPPDSGPMWEIDTAFDGRSLMGPGAIPTSNPAKTLAVNEQFGEGAHQMTSQEVGPHTHEPSPKSMATSPGSGSVQGILFGGSGDARPDLAVLANTYTAGQQNMPIVHPVVGRFIIRRTARLNYTP